MLRLSIIIPFYNVERYIAECLDSVFDQDIPLKEYEVICVNDGSPDNSREIVLDYMKRYPNLKLIEHDRNRKLGTARNTGRSIAQGRYIWNVDSDDKIAPNCLREMLEVCEENDLDVLEFCAYKWNGTGVIQQTHCCPSQMVCSGVDYFNALNIGDSAYLLAVWKKIIKKSFLDEYNIYSPEINMGEDVPYSLSVYLWAKRILVTSKIYYFYRINENSLTGLRWKPTPETLYEKSFVNAKTIFPVMYKIPRQAKNFKRIVRQCLTYTLNCWEKYISLMDANERILFFNLVRKNLYCNLDVLFQLPIKEQIKYLKIFFNIGIVV